MGQRACARLRQVMAGGTAQRRIADGVQRLTYHDGEFTVVTYRLDGSVAEYRHPDAASLDMRQWRVIAEGTPLCPYPKTARGFLEHLLALSSTWPKVNELSYLGYRPAAVGRRAGWYAETYARRAFLGRNWREAADTVLTRDASEIMGFRMEQLHEACSTIARSLQQYPDRAMALVAMSDGSPAAVFSHHADRYPRVLQRYEHQGHLPPGGAPELVACRMMDHLREQGLDYT